MEQQTAMMELIMWLEVGWKDEDVDTVIKKATELLEKEKDDIVSAYRIGASRNNQLKGLSYEFFQINAEKFYNDSYKH